MQPCMGKITQSALPLLNLLDILTINNIYEPQALKSDHNWIIGIIKRCFPYLSLSHTLKRSTHSILDMPQKTIYIRHTLEVTWRNI